MEPRPLVGRDEELRRLRDVVERARVGSGSALGIAGVAGLGKSALVDRICAESRDLLIVRAAGVETEMELPFATLDAVTRSFHDHLDDLPDVQRRALAGALALADSEPADSFALRAATLSLLGIAGEETPVLCVVDDLHWVDDVSRAALLFAARRLHHERVAMLFAYRPEELQPGEMRGIDVLTVAPLPDAASEALVAERTDARLPQETMEQLVAAASGNPLTLIELITRLSRDQLEGREPLLGPPLPPAHAGDLLAERVRSLSQSTRVALLVTAACGEPELELVRRALASEGLELGDLVPAEDADLIELSPPKLSWRHPLVRSIAYHAEPPGARRSAHAAVAAALDPDDARRPWHLAAAASGPDEDVAAALAGEAQRLRLRGGFSASGAALRRAADMTLDPARKASRLLAAGRDLELGGRYEDAHRALDAALPLTGSTLAAPRVRGLKAGLLLREGRLRDARTQLIAQARLLEQEDPHAAARFHMQAAFACVGLVEVEPWEEEARTALALLPPEEHTDRDVGKALLASALVAGMRMAEAEPLLESVERHVVERDPDKPLGGSVEVFALMARSLIWIERWPAAERILTRLESDARRINAAAGLPYVLNVRSILEMRLGRWARAQASAAEAEALTRDTGNELFFFAAAALRCWVAALLGNSDEAEAAAREACSAPQFDSLPRSVASYALGLLALARGRIDEAVEKLGAVDDGMGCPEPGSRPWEADLIEALIRHGDDSAEHRLSAWEEAGSLAGRPLVLATAARCRGLICPEPEIEATFERALAHHEKAAVPFEWARTLLCLGERRRRAKRRQEAREPLRLALEEFERLGAADWALRARSELRATGGMVPARTDRDGEELTPHETQVAVLVAEGMTNREVAAALFLAPKTIEHHLSTIFRKLGIRRRTELASVFASEGRGPQGVETPVG